MVKKRLTNEVIFRLTHPKTLWIRKGLGQVLGMTQAGIPYALNNNLWNGTLTTETALSYLEEKMGMSRERMPETEREEQS
jgi:hypothetical protein